MRTKERTRVTKQKKTRTGRKTEKYAEKSQKKTAQELCIVYRVSLRHLILLLEPLSLYFQSLTHISHFGFLLAPSLYIYTYKYIYNFGKSALLIDFGMECSWYEIWMFLLALRCKRETVTHTEKKNPEQHPDLSQYYSD